MRFERRSQVCRTRQNSHAANNCLFRTVCDFTGKVGWWIPPRTADANLSRFWQRFGQTEKALELGAVLYRFRRSNVQP